MDWDEIELTKRNLLSEKHLVIDDNSADLLKSSITVRGSYCPDLTRCLGNLYVISSFEATPVRDCKNEWRIEFTFKPIMKANNTYSESGN